MNNYKLKQLWNELTDFTYIYGMEDEVIEIINNYISVPLKRDEYGNYYIKIGKSKSLFVSHLDVVAKQKLKVTKKSYRKENSEIIKTDGFTILGADDKTGVVIMLNMIDNNTPGTYYFLIGEEVGTVGSGLLYKEKGKELSKYNRCVAFDRKGYGSIINRQMGEYCCSDEFVDALSNEFNNNGMIFTSDSKGVWTDSALFMGIIPECTNLSVGYFNEHTYREEQDIDYMLQLSKVVINIDWENLPTVRKPKTFDTDEPLEVDHNETHLPLYKLQNIFNDVDDLIYELTGSFSSNTNFFKPNKEMKFFKISDTKGKYNFNIIVFWDGSIKMIKDTKITMFDNFKDFKDMVDEDYLKKFINTMNNERIVTKFDYFKKLNENIKDLLKGPSDEEILYNFKDLTPNELLDKSIKLNFQKGIEVALDRGADKNIYNKYLEMKEWFVNLISNMDEIKLDKYPQSVFWKKSNKILFEQDFRNNRLWTNYDKIWSVFENKYGYKYDYTELLIDNITKEYLNWVGLTPYNVNSTFGQRWKNI